MDEFILGAQYHLVELETLTETRKPKTPQFSVQNDTDGDRRVFGMSITPDALFSTKGIINIYLNGVRMLPVDDRDQGMLKSVTALNVPIPANFGLRIQPRKKLEVFVWNPDGVNATVNFSTFIGDIRK